MRTWMLIAALAAMPQVVDAEQPSGNPPAGQPNILWIITDDQRSDSLSCYNRAVRGTDESALGFVSSPNVDALATEGVLFTRAYHKPYERLATFFRNKLGNIVLGDGRVECDWTQENKYHISNFAPGSHERKLNIPEGIATFRR